MTKKYTLIFTTHNFQAGGTTDNKVFVDFLGSKGNTFYPSGLIHVNGQGGEPNRIFEKANKQTFEVEGEDVGEVTKLRVIHENKVGLFMWHLASVMVVTDKQRTTFEANQWLDKREGGSELIIDLAPKKKKVVDEDRSLTNVNTRYGQAMRSIDKEKNKVNKDTEAYKVLAKADEIMKSKHFIAKQETSKTYLKTIGILDEETFHQRMEEQAIDMAEREYERTHEFMQYERAGLSAKEQEDIPKLDESNNFCYEYLRAYGNMWQYDPEKIDPRMKGRLYRRFDTFDKDSDGIMTISEVLTWADRMKSVCDNTTEEEITKVRNALEYYFTMYGLGGDGLHRENWVEAHVAMGVSAEERKKQGDPIPMEVLANAYFDVIDENDDGVLDLPELKKMMNVFRVPEEAAYPFFEMADEDNSGLLERKEMHKLFYSFWFGNGFCEYENHLDHIFAYKY